MSHRTWFLFTICGLLAAASSSCSHPNSANPPMVRELFDNASNSSAQANEDSSAEGTATARQGQPTDGQPGNAESATPPDAEEVLKTALARAGGEKKQVLVHLGAPG